MEQQVENGAIEDAKLRDDIEKAKNMSDSEKAQALAKLLQLPQEKRFYNPLKIKLLIELMGIEMVNFNAETYAEPSFTYYNVTPMTSAGFRDDERSAKMIDLYLCEYLKMKYEGKENPELYKEILNYYNASYLGFYSKSKYSFIDKMRDFPERFKNAMENAEKELQVQLGGAFSSEKLKAVNEQFEEKFIPDAYQLQMDARYMRKFDAFLFSGLIVSIPFVWTWYAVKAAQDPIKPETVELLKQRSNEKQPSVVDNYPDLLTSQADVDSVAELPQSNIYRHIPHALTNACKIADPKAVKALLNQKKENEQPLFSTKEAFINIFLPLREKHRGWQESRGIRWLTHSNFDKQRKILEDKKRDIDDLKNREICIRLILQDEKAKLKEQFPKLSDDEINRQVADKFINTRYKITDGNYTTESGVLYLQPHIGEACSLIKVITEELGVENIDFYCQERPNNYGWSPMKDAACFLFEPDFKMIEVYLCEYLKMNYEGKANNTLYPEIVKFFYSRDFANDFFPEKMRLFPEVFAKAVESANRELKQKHGDKFDESKLNNHANQFEEKFMPDAYEMQKQRRNKLLGIIAPIAPLLIMTVVFIPVVAIWYAYKVSKEPIKVRKTTGDAFDIYSKSQEGKEQTDQDISLEESLASRSSYSNILDDSAKAGKAPLNPKIQANGKVEWRRPAVVKHKGDKVMIFSLSEERAKKLDRDIKLAEKQESQSKSL